jgi:pimeloyl-ACP methyl ester carboxylesterase
MLKRLVLVHGAWHGAWCWERLTPLLQARGFEVSTLDLPGLGSDLTRSQDVTLQNCVERVVSVIAVGHEPVLLVGHSMGGVPISAAAELVPERISRLVYIAALLPANGETLTDVSGIGAAESVATTLQPNTADGDYAVDPAIAPQMFYNTCSADVAAHAARQLRPQSLRPLGTQVSLTEARWGRIPKTYILCAKDNALPYAQQQALCARRPEVRKLTMDTDHSPFYSDPEGLSQLLAAEASFS